MASEHTNGGFTLSPPQSLASTTSHATSTLPHPRGTPLRAGGSKESAFIRYVDQRILHIQRRFAKRTSPSAPTLADTDREKADDWGDVAGYSSMREACREIENLVDVVWVSGTPSLQVPYLINLALLLSTVIPAMPPTPRSLFRVLAKLDYCFASLIQGRDVETGESLPGFAGHKGVSGTEKVRVRSLVERTRVEVVESFKKGEFEYEDPGTEHGEGELMLEGGDVDEMGDDGEDSNDMQIARVYDRTIQELGDSLEAPGIGIITEKRG
ncbi:hypothetical protein BAUCODRAFT_386323 [Baudoinia panamericana UAMH 10762]|uniref:Uncharacterized protein n=1 Tax=Baudoinia panamericana (strain UAMH 10762) TaxID=717646 RepID=M2MQB1_BAUPA|nr:uncharacterized protein BAUCODRAFT_386323 [Baudoinia panamericana UAMH 10762]EMC98966.1 hypothetical protein BAUCODRAFT_386323 [Baudoinia panamericana UAMH 10762]